ncbi:radical SAM protein, partial [bacterium]|nr:radical SAM protein [bacterium]
MAKEKITNNFISSQKKYFNTGDGFQLQPMDIGHKHYIGLISPDTAFWTLVKKNCLGQVLTDSSFLYKYRKKEKSFLNEMNLLRFGLKPSAVYFNPTDRCNMNCSYCYIPEELRKHGKHMSTKRVLKALEILKDYFQATLPKDQIPQIVFHGAEPMLNKEAVFSAIERFDKYFRFGIQTNGTLLDSEAIKFLTSRKISIGLSIDGGSGKVADKLRKTWNGKGVFQKVTKV